MSDAHCSPAWGERERGEDRKERRRNSRGGMREACACRGGRGMDGKRSENIRQKKDKSRQ